jgi:hypothetical protein
MMQNGRINAYYHVTPCSLVSGAKTLGWDTQKFGKCFENLGKVLTLPKCKY